jgi:hypothetical protein
MNNDENKSRNEVLRILKYAILEIRLEAKNINNRKIYKLANLIHNVPGMVDSQSFNWDQVMHEIRKQAEWSNMEQWMKTVLVETEGDNIKK